MAECGKKCRVKQRTKTQQKRPKIFMRSRNNVNSVNIEQTSEDFVNNGVNIDVHNDVNSGNTSSVNNSFDSLSTSMNSTVSLRKVKVIECSTPNSTEKITGYRFMEMEVLFNVISILSCPDCSSAKTLSLSEKIGDRKGFASSLNIHCNSCGYNYNFFTSATNGKSYEINDRTVYAMRACGQGYGGLKTFSAVMNLPGPMTSNNYNKIVENLSTAAKEVAEETMQEAAQELRSDTDNEPTIDAEVSCDGTWQRRGCSSRNGVVSVISMKTDKILDVESMYKTCKAYCLNENLMNNDPVAYNAWKENHKCTFNYHSTADGMEPEGAKGIWERSVAKRNVRYVKFYGDGDSKAYDIVKSVYGNDSVEKLMCVGHVQKRVGARMRSLKKRENGLGGRGKLTDATIDRLQNYYGIAIRQNKITWKA